jgi:hypothetical protein
MKQFIKNVLSQGSRLVYLNLKFISLFILTNIAFAIALSLPLFSTVKESLVHSSINDRLSEGFDYLWYAQFRHIFQSSLDVLPFVIYATVGIYVFIQVFFLGGLLSVLINTQKNHFVDFFYGGVKYFWRFTKIMLISFSIYYIAISMLDYVGYLLNHWLADKQDVVLEFILQALRYVILIGVIAAINMISDFTKIIIAVKDSDYVLKEISESMKFIYNDFSKVFLVYFSIACIGAAGVIAYNVIDSALPRYPIYFLVISFIIQQFLIIFRLLIRMFFYSSAIVVYNDLTAPVIQTNVEEVSLGV